MKITRLTADNLKWLANDIDAIATRLNEDGFDTEAESIREATHIMRKAIQSIYAKTGATMK